MTKIIIFTIILLVVVLRLVVTFILVLNYIMKKYVPNELYSEIECKDNLSAVEDALYVIGGKWKLRIIIVLVSGYTRFNEIQRRLNGISARVLSSELKSLEINKLVKRVVYSNEIPVIIEYIPTDYAKSLKSVVSILAKWGIKHRKEISSD